MTNNNDDNKMNDDDNNINKNTKQRSTSTSNDCLVDLSLDSISTASSTDTESSYSDNDVAVTVSAVSSSSSSNSSSNTRIVDEYGDTSDEGPTTPNPHRTTVSVVDLERQQYHQQQQQDELDNERPIQHHHHHYDDDNDPSSSPSSVLRHRPTIHVGDGAPSVSSTMIFPSSSFGDVSTTSNSHHHHRQQQQQHLSSLAIVAGGNDDANNRDGGDSDSEHGLIPRRQRRRRSLAGNVLDFMLRLQSSRQPRKSSKSFFFTRPYIFYTVALVIGLSSIARIKTLFRTEFMTPESIAWKAFVQHQVPILRKTIAKTKHQRQRDFTVVLSGGRIDLIQQSLDAMSACPSVDSIRLDYQPRSSNPSVKNAEGGVSSIPVSLLSHGSGKVQPAMKPPSMMTTTATNQARSVYSSFSTDAIFLVQEGILLSCTELEKAFETWKNDPSRLVGFYGYRGMTSIESGLVPVESGSGTYAFVSDRAVFTHKAYLDSLPLDNLEDSESIDGRGDDAGGSNAGDAHSGSNCCDVSLSLKVSVALGKSPVVLKSRAVDLLGGSDKPRQSMINHFSRSQTGRHQTRGGNQQQQTVCDCTPNWMQLTDIQSIPESESAVVASS